MNEDEGRAKDLNSNPAATESSSTPSETPDPMTTIASSSPELTGGTAGLEPKFIGPYKLLRRLGVGGMGQVWLAEQTAPVQRQVALKLIKVGRYDDELLLRFRSERQSLAMMDHPAIAKVFDAGATPDGQPYFVMEHVPGVPITKYCDDKRLTMRQRLELFFRVCEGVQHAHQKAIIHRDLKPANILVTEVDGKPMPRIIDFGLAKAIGPQISDETMMTRAGDWVGTPGYMSPEQADGNADIDTRTDVYSLGVVLYVLLTGDQPFDVGPEHPQTLRAMTMLALTMVKEGRYSEANKLQSQVIEIKARVLGPTHTSTLQSMEMEAWGLSREGHYADSEKMFRDVIETAEKTSQPATVAEAWYNFACAEAARGRPDEAFADLNHAIENGLISPGELSADPELKSLHGDPRFDALVAKARATNSARKK